MTNIDDIPSHFINKAGIANRLGISRVTVDRALTKVSKDPILNSRLKVNIVSEGKRTLYFYDPSDVDTVFAELQRSSKSRSKTVRSINRKVTTKSTDQSTALLEKDVQHLQSLLAKSESEVADLKGQRDKKDRQIEFLQAQLTDQRPVVLPEAPEPKREEVVPTITEVEQPKLATVREIREAVSRASKPNLKKPIQRNSKNSAFFVKEPEVSTLDPATTEIKTEIDREETPDVTMARLKYKIDRGEYKLAETVYAQQVWNIITDRKDEVPNNVKNSRYNDVLWEERSKTNTAFDTKFKTKELLEINDYTEIHQHLREDLKHRALVDPLLQFPNDLVKEIAEETERLSKENVVELKEVKQQKAIDEAKQEDEDLDRLLPDVMDHFNPMAEAEIALLDEEIASAREAKAKVEAKEEQLSPEPPTLDMDKPTEVEDEAEIEAEARRTRMVEAPKAQKKKPRGLIAWLKGY